MLHRGFNNLAWLETLTRKSSIITDGLNGKFDPDDESSYDPDVGGTTFSNLITGDDDGGDLYLANGLEEGHIGVPAYFMFDGSDDYMGNLAASQYSAAVKYDFNVNINNFTISFWWYASSFSAGNLDQIFSVGNVAYSQVGHHGLSMSMDDSSDKLSLYTFDNDEADAIKRTTTDDIGRQMWNYISVVKEGSTDTLRVYVNGEYQHMSNSNEDDGSSDLDILGTGAQPIQFGKTKVDSVIRYTSGESRIGMILLYNTKALKKSEIMSNFLAKKSDYGH